MTRPWQPDRSQPERTALAWRRTALSLGVAAGLSTRVLVPILGPAGVGLAVAGVVGAFWVWWAGTRRYRARRPGEDGAGRRSGGLTLAFVSGLAAAAGLAALLFVLTPLH